MNFEGLKFISTKQLKSRKDIDIILDLAKRVEPYGKGLKYTDILKDKVMATLFYEPSTRTKFSFNSAAYRLGANIISEIEPKFSSMYKGETLQDTLRMVEQYSDIIVMRHPERGSAKLASNFLSKPFINAGDGAGEHPTQALLDVYTILKEREEIDGLNIMLCGDLMYGRTIHSLIELLKFYEIRLFLVSPNQLTIPKKIKNTLDEYKVNYEVSTKMEDFLPITDLLYMTRVQKERFVDIEEYEKLKNSYIVDLNVIKKAKKGLSILHPLPRVNEISTEVDNYSGAAYFRQAGNGVYIRMALILLLLDRQLNFK